MSTAEPSGDRWSQWPINFESLEPGIMIGFDEIAERFGILPPKELDSKQWRAFIKKVHFEKMRLAKAISEFFKLERGSWVRARAREDGVEIYDVNHHLQHTKRRIACGRRTTVRNSVEHLSIPTHELVDEETRKQKAEDDRKIAFQLQQLRKRPPPRLTNREE